MRGYLLDTNVLSELRRPACDRNVAAFADNQPVDFLFTSAVNFAEIQFGIDTLLDPVKRSAITEWLSDTLRPWFGTNVAEADEAAICEWRHIVEQGRKRRYTFSEPDCLIAAIARVNRLVVVTRDMLPFQEAGVAVLDPWRGRFHNSRNEVLEPLALDDPRLLEAIGHFEGSAGS